MHLSYLLNRLSLLVRLIVRKKFSNFNIKKTHSFEIKKREKKRKKKREKASEIWKFNLKTMRNHL